MDKLLEITANAESRCTNHSWIDNKRLHQVSLALLTQTAIEQTDLDAELAEYPSSVLEMLAEHAITPESGISATYLRNEMVGKGLPALAVTMALRELERRSYVERIVRHDDVNGGDDIVLVAPEEGLTFLEAIIPKNKLLPNRQAELQIRGVPAVRE